MERYPPLYTCITKMCRLKPGGSSFAPYYERILDTLQLLSSPLPARLESFTNHFVLTTSSCQSLTSNCLSISFGRAMSSFEERLIAIMLPVSYHPKEGVMFPQKSNPAREIHLKALEHGSLKRDSFPIGSIYMVYVPTFTIIYHKNQTRCR